MKLTSAAFAVLLKFSDSISTFETFLGQVKERKGADGTFSSIAQSFKDDSTSEFQLFLKRWD